ncbi:probable RNA-dependent RNA polymerase 5 isoform X3 [Carica papaya]|uniref:probable RNA-dependent RNA polymerase 5 isoform X3 n=1 Tax=Carica papaya TaxID=3649 RepID=UPI000B8CA2E1|nr:probable RNA-dependent RNA polymerase 5 isoform X3 [Carica papaya]
MAQRSRNGSPSPLKCVCSSPCSPNPSTNDAVMMSQDSLDKNRNFPPSILDGADGQRHSAQLVALGELEFRKAFLLLSYLGEKRLEDAISADEIRKLKDLPMHNFELEVWNAFGQQYIKKEERKNVLLISLIGILVKHISIAVMFLRMEVAGSRFQGPYLEKTATHMHRVLGDDNVLMVKFAEEMTNKENSALSVNDLYFKYHRFASEGIFVGLRRYRFFVFKDGGKEEKKKDSTTSSVKCYFVHMESKAFTDKDQEYILSGKTIQEARSIFMHVHGLPNIAKYMARLVNINFFFHPFAFPCSSSLGLIQRTFVKEPFSIGHSGFHLFCQEL